MESQMVRPHCTLCSSLPALVLNSARTRRFVLRDNVLMYFSTPKDFTGARRHA